MKKGRFFEKLAALLNVDIDIVNHRAQICEVNRSLVVGNKKPAGPVTKQREKTIRAQRVVAFPKQYLLVSDKKVDVTRQGEIGRDRVDADLEKTARGFYFFFGFGHRLPK